MARWVESTEDCNWPYFTNSFQECTDSGVIQLRENTKSKVERITYNRNLQNLYINKFKNDFIVDLEQNHSEYESFDSAYQNFLNCFDNLCPLNKVITHIPHGLNLSKLYKHKDILIRVEKLIRNIQIAFLFTEIFV